jgi:hypothetical protein
MAKKYQERLAMSSGLSSSKTFESDFGKRVLMKYGWEEGQGLGRLGNGRTECVQGQRREEKKGLGAEKRSSEDQWDNWWADCFNNVAQRLSSKDSLDRCMQQKMARESEAQEDGSSTTASKRSASEMNETVSDSVSDSDSDTDVGGKTKSLDGARITAVKRAGAMAGKLRRVQRQEASVLV